jgi:ABC-2 type transport system ATP-binding protein
MMWFCGGHGVCLTNPGNQQLLTQATFDWLDRYVKGDTKAPTFPRFQFVDQNGVEYHAADFPLPLTAPFTATGSGTLTLVAGGGSGPAHPPADSPDPLAGIAGIITPARATNAVNVVIPTGSRTAVVIGAPRLTLTYEGSADPGSLPTRVYAQLVDDHTGVVLGNQITPIDVTLDGRAHTTTVPLEMVVYHATPGQHVTLQLVATTVAYGPNRLGGHVHFSHIAISLPVAAHP